MLDKISPIFRDRCKLEKERSLLVGVSGGPDSLCLLSLLHQAGYPVIAAHFNHGLRPEAGEEAAAVESLAGSMGVPFVGGGEDVRRYAEVQKLSIETAARDLRYGFLFRQARESQAQAVAVGHTADDQVETVLMHFLRGAGLKGLRGMTYRAFLRGYDPEIPLVRPLLDFWREDTVAYCAANQLEPRHDASNDSRDYLRNRVRHELIPTLEAYNPRFREAAWRSSKTLGADHDLLARSIEPLWQQAVKQSTSRFVAFDLDRVRSLEPAVQMHLLRRAIESLLPDNDTGYAELERAAEFLADPALDRVDLTGGLLLVREFDTAYMAAGEASLPHDQWPQFQGDQKSMRFSPPAALALADGWKLSADCRPIEELDSKEPWRESDPNRAFLDAERLPRELALRPPKAGDRFQPLGLDGHSQKLSDFFINSKLPARVRQRWPLVCAGEEIIWVAGFRPAHSYRLVPQSKSVLCLAVTKAA